MKAPRFFRRGSRRGFALLTVLMFIGIMALLTASILQYSGSERRLNERNRLILRARNMAENVALYASEQLTTKLYRLRSTAQMAFTHGSNRVHLPPDTVLTTSYSDPDDVEVWAGLIGSTGLQYIDPNVGANASDPNVGLSVDKSTVPIIAKATMRHSALGAVTAYAQQDLQIAMIPLFQFAVFYNMDMEFGPGPDMIINGPVHTNGSLIARIQTGFGNTLQFTDRVTAAKGFYANTTHKGPIYMGNGGVDNGPGGTGPLYFQKPTGTVTNIKTSSGVWRDHKYGTNTETSTTRNQFKTFATSTYAGNLRTSVHGITPLELPSIGGYKEADDPNTPEDDRRNGRQIIEAPAPSDSADLVQAKLSRRSGLYIVVNPDDEERAGRLPDGSSVNMRARSYRAWLNTVNINGSYTLAEVILPGQPSYGALNANLNRLPNAYRTDTSVGSNQVLRIPQGGGVDPSNTGYADPDAPALGAFTDRRDSYFYDLRRGKGSNSHPFARNSDPFIPRPIAKVDFDLTRFKMAVDRSLSEATTSAVYNPATPTAANWSSSILNANANASSHGLGLGPTFSNLNASELLIQSFQMNSSGNTSLEPVRYIIEQSIDGAAWTDRYVSGADESSKTYTVNATTKFVRVREYLGGGAPGATEDGWGSTTTRMMDEVIIPVLPVDGSTTAVAVLTNEYHVVPTSNSSNSVPSTHRADGSTRMRIFVGGVEDTENWTIDEQPSSRVGTFVGAFGTGPDANLFTVTSITSNQCSVGLRARKGATTLTKTFRMERQASKTAFDAPAQKARWISAALGGDPFQIYFAPEDPNDARIVSDPDAFRVRAADLVNTGGPCPWFDGITVYVHSVEAEDKTLVSGVPQRVDSGVRLWNGRGSVASLSRATYPGRTGFSFVTNDAVYIVGHFNADGSINSNSNSNSNPGGYSGRYAESANEMLCAVMGDAITILSQPVFVQNSGNYYQSTGWADSLSAHRRDDNNWSSNWQTSNPSGSNSVDGISNSLAPACLPNLTKQTGANAGAGSAVSTKLDPTVTEVSCCLLTGIVRTTNASSIAGDTTTQTSGGVHNFPRLLENWNGTGLYIRGSMVAMFESQVATEPWSIRYYQGAGRYWGLHQNLRAENGAHDLPLEPIVLNAQRIRYREITPAEYATQKAIIQALPH